MRLGSGLVQDEQNRVVATRYGVVRKAAGSRIWVDSYQKRYVASVGDWVVGVVVEKHFDNYRVDIGESQPARLPSLAFEGATKRNRPNLAVGTLIYCLVVMANKHMETELSCVSPVVKKEWVTGQCLFGPLVDGYKIDCSLRLARSLMSERCVVLSSLGEKLQFEVAIGLNGQVWVHSSSALVTVIVCNAILNSEFMSDEQARAMVAHILKQTGM